MIFNFWSPLVVQILVVTNGDDFIGILENVTFGHYFVSKHWWQHLYSCKIIFKFWSPLVLAMIVVTNGDEFFGILENITFGHNFVI